MKIGAIFDDRYAIDATLGEGGFAVVYAARDRQTQHRVALKVLKPDDAGGRYQPDTVARFEREIALLSRLRSPYTVRLLGRGMCDGQLYAVFEHIDGRDLSELLQSVRRLESRWVLHILRQVLESLAEAHAAGLVHRDIKPANIRVFERDGDPMAVKLLDFGIARPTDSSHPAVTKAGELIGTPRYMSPEQLTGRQLTPASDIYSLGLVGFELLTGAESLQGNRWTDQIERLRSGHLFSVAEIERVGPELLQLLQRMTARAPEDRFPSAPAVLSALAALERAPTATTRVSARDETALAGDDVRGSGPPAVAQSASVRKLVIALSLGLIATLVVLLRIRPEEAVEPAPSRGPERLTTLLKGNSSAGEPASPPEVDAGIDVADAVDLARTDIGPPVVEAPRSTGCGALPPMIDEMELEGVLTYVPRDYDENRPHALYVLLHNDIQRPARVMSKSDLRKISDRQHALIIAPPGSGYPLYVDSWRTPDEVDDVVAATRRTGERYCIDESRIFVVGNGEGGRVAYALSCEPWVAGVAIVASLVHSAKQPFQCRDGTRVEPKPAILINPTQSNIVPLDGRANCKGRVDAPIDQIEDAWRKRNGCGHRVDDAFVAPGIRCHAWDDCRAPLESCYVEGGEPWLREKHANLSICTEPKPGRFRSADRIGAFFEALSAEK